MTLPIGTTLFHDGDPCESFLLVVDGVVRVQKTSETGREIVLYRVEAGESCILTTATLLGATRYTATGIAETTLHGAIVPRRLFHELLGASDSFRRFVFDSYAARMADLMLLIEEVAFGRIDIRLARLLLEKATGQTTIEATHHDLATELGTAREVVSRQLKHFEHRGWVSCARGHLEILARADLRDLAEERKI